MSIARHAAASGGFTLIELMIVIALLALLLALAIPAFTGLLAKKRVEGVVSELVTDLQFARSEAVARNTNVRVTFGAGCYVVHTVGGSATSCTQAGGAATGAGATSLKTVTLPAGSTLSLSAPANAFIDFEPVRGAPTSSNLGNPPTVTATNSVGTWHASVCVGAVGRTVLYSTAGTGHIAGYATECLT